MSVNYLAIIPTVTAYVTNYATGLLDSNDTVSRSFAFRLVKKGTPDIDQSPGIAGVTFPFIFNPVL
jgi:hypothetical protein